MQAELKTAAGEHLAEKINVIVFMVRVDALTNYRSEPNLVFYWEKKMKFNYNKLWKMLIDRNMMEKDLYLLRWPNSGKSKQGKQVCLNY